MQLITETLLLCVLIVIFLQDIRSRAVYWLFFPALTAGLVALSLLTQKNLTLYLADLAMNLGFLLIQLLLLSAYFALKQRRFVNITKGLLHWGDILLLASLCFYLSFKNYLLFYVASLPVSLMVWTLIKKIGNHQDQTIPLAGLQAFLFAVCLVGDRNLFHLNIASDNWIDRQLLWI